MSVVLSQISNKLSYFFLTIEGAVAPWGKALVSELQSYQRSSDRFSFSDFWIGVPALILRKCEERYAVFCFLFLGSLLVSSG